MYLHIVLIALVLHTEIILSIITVLPNRSYFIFMECFLQALLSIEPWEVLLQQTYVQMQEAL